MPITSSVHEDNQVFTFSGYVDGGDNAIFNTGYVVAESPLMAIEAMRECGFIITAITSLAEVKQTIRILEMIALQHPEVERSEFLVAYSNNSNNEYPEDNVFCFTGHVVDASGSLKSGFIVASDVQFVIDYLHGFGFVVESAMSLLDLRRVMSEMLLIANEDQSIDHSHFINFKELA